MRHTHYVWCGSIVVGLCLLLQTQSGWTAPAQHLAISVAGNTPTLIVTSAEIGITPKVRHAGKPTATTAATAATVAGLLSESGEALTEKQRSKVVSSGKKNRSNKLQYSKKRLQYVSKEKQLLKEKSLVLTTVTPATTTVAQETSEHTTVEQKVASNEFLKSTLAPERTTQTASPLATAAAAITEPDAKHEAAKETKTTTENNATLATTTSSFNNDNNQYSSSSSSSTAKRVVATEASTTLKPETFTPYNKPILSGSDVASKPVTEHTVSDDMTPTLGILPRADTAAATSATEKPVILATTNDAQTEALTPVNVAASAGNPAPVDDDDVKTVTPTIITTTTTKTPATNVVVTKDTTAEKLPTALLVPNVDSKKVPTIAPTTIGTPATTITSATEMKNVKVTAKNAKDTEVSEVDITTLPMATAKTETAAVATRLKIASAAPTATATITRDMPVTMNTVETLPTETTATKITKTTKVNANNCNGGKVVSEEMEKNAAATTIVAIVVNNSRQDVIENVDRVKNKTQNFEQEIYKNRQQDLNKHTDNITTVNNSNIKSNQDTTPERAATATEQAAATTMKTNKFESTTTTKILAETSTKTSVPKSTKTTLATTAITTESDGIIFIDNVQADEPQRQQLPPPAVLQHHHDDTAVGIVKLIDLEKHDLKSIEGSQLQHPPNAYNDSHGHDGVKRTRKKQLFDKHFLLPDIIDTMAAAAQTTIGTTRAAPTTTKPPPTRTPLKAAKTLKITQAASTPSDSSSVVTAPPVAAASATKAPTVPLLMPVPNGYLGPIFMEEKTFTVIHAPQHKPPHHETSIESQLRNGRLVEILAPTALRDEQTNPTVAPTTPPVPTAVATEKPLFIASNSISTPPHMHNTLDVDAAAPVLSTTVFQVPEPLSSTTRLPVSAHKEHDFVFDDVGVATMQQKQKERQQPPKSTKAAASKSPKVSNNERTESKISDIQIEVYDSTVDSIVASTNFKDNEGYNALPLESAVGTTKPPAHIQERFTQYVVDRTDYATQESSVAPFTVVSGKPEPAAIEIHINVSEGVGNESEDLEFSYRQPDYYGNSRANEFAAKSTKTLSVKPFAGGSIARNDTNTVSNERSDEILVVEIIDTGDNSTENAVSAENINPIFTFRSEPDAEVELKDIKYYPSETIVKPPQVSDELFMPDVKKSDDGLGKPPLPPPPPPRKPTLDRDSDTIFYISNTEVKVGESVPTANTNYDQQQQQMRKSRLENQFFPANYMASTHPNAARLDESIPQRHRYEEDIILSPLRNTADSLKIFRSQSDGAPPLDVTYVGESIMEVEQSSGAGIITTNAPATPLPDIIIQPAILPEIGVPVIGELPPQIELKEIDFMPDEASQLHTSIYNNNNLDDNTLNNEVERLVESSIQYGGDLIDETFGVGGGFDGIEGSYPFGNPVAMHGKTHHAADYAHFTVNHGVSNLRKDELSADVASSGEMVVSLAAGNMETNGTLKELLANKNGNETVMVAAAMPISMNGSFTERMSNATAYSVMEDPSGTYEEVLSFMNISTLIIGLFIVLLPVVLTVSMACAVRYLYIKYQPFTSAAANASDTNDNTNPANGDVGKVESGSGGGDGGVTQDEQDTTKSEYNKNAKTPHYQNTNTTVKIQKPSNGSSNSLHVVDEKTSLTLTKAPAITMQPLSITSASSNEANKSSKTPKTESDQSNNSVQGNYARPNGSVTKMTLKNNHLIVETEERHDISRDARETKMHYNTSDKDGVFVVEVSRGVDSKTIPDSPVIDGTEQRLPIYETKNETPTVAASTNLKSENEKALQQQEEVQIHQPPANLPPNQTNEELQRSLHQIVEVDEPIALTPNTSNHKADTNLVYNSNTGLSQSDLSSTSSTDSNKCYSYGNQELYTIEQTGYATASPTAHAPLTPVVNGIAEDDDRKSENGNSPVKHSPTTQASGVSSVTTHDMQCNNLHAGVNVCQNTNKSMQQLEVEPKDEVIMPEEQILPAEEVTTSHIGVSNENTTNGEKPGMEDDVTITEQDTIDEKPIKPVDVTMNIDPPLANGQLSPANGELELATIKIDTPPPQLEDGNAYDSIMSLPDPPSTEEIKQLYDCSLNDINQLDSLPPPPPPPLAADVNDNTDNTQQLNELKIKQQLPPPTTATAAAPLTNGDNNNTHMGITSDCTDNSNGNADEEHTALPPTHNGHEEISHISDMLPPPTNEVNSMEVHSGKVLSAPLTPPASTPNTPPGHYSNGLSSLNGLNGVPMPLVVDVNGS